MIKPESVLLSLVVLSGLMFIVSFIVSFVFFYRNNRVCEYRLKMIDVIHQANLQDFKSSEWRWQQYKAVSYDAMLYKIWRPLSSFYDEEAIKRGQSHEFYSSQLN